MDCKFEIVKLIKDEPITKDSKTNKPRKVSKRELFCTKGCKCKNKNGLKKQ